MVSSSAVMTLPELFKLLGVSRPTGYAAARQNLLPVPVIKIGLKRMVVSRAAVERLLSAQTNNQTE